MTTLAYLICVIVLVIAAAAHLWFLAIPAILAALGTIFYARNGHRLGVSWPPQPSNG